MGHEFSSHCYNIISLFPIVKEMCAWQIKHHVMQQEHITKYHAWENDNIERVTGLGVFLFMIY